MRFAIKRKAVATGLAAGLLGCLLSANALALETYNSGSLDFASTDQSMWGSGAAFQFDYNKFIGKTWDASTSIGPGVDCVLGVCGGAEATISTNGKIGFQLDAKIDSGSVDSQVQMNAQALLPDPRVGSNFFNLNPTSSLTGGQFTTSSPNFQASLDAVLGAHVGVSGEACVAACISGSTGIGIGDKDHPKTFELLSVNRDNNGEIKVAGSTVAGGGTQFPIDVAGTQVGNVTPNIPLIQTTGGASGGTLSSTGQDDLVTLTADIDGLITLGLGLPPLEGSLDFGIGSVSYNLADVELGPIIKIFQDFEITPTLMVTLNFDSDVLVDLGGGMTELTRSVTAAWNDLPNIAMLHSETTVTPTWSLAAMLHNQTGLGLDLLFQFSLFSGSWNLFDVASGSYGPLYSFSQRLTGPDFPPIFNSNFALGGFNSIVGQSFVIKVPEPASLALFGVGLLGLGLRKRRKSAGRAA